MPRLALEYSVQGGKTGGCVAKGLGVPGKVKFRLALLEADASFDLPATLLARMDIAGAEQLTRQQAGVDLLDPAYSPRSIIATTSARRELTDNLDESTLMTDRWKFVRHGTGGASLYDLDVDPYELRDVSVLYPDLCEDFAKELGGTLASQRSKGGGFTRDATPEEIEALEALGYAGGTGDGLGRPNREKDGDGEDGGEEE